MKMNEWSMMKADFCFHSPRIAWLLSRIARIHTNRKKINGNGNTVSFIQSTIPHVECIFIFVLNSIAAICCCCIFMLCWRCVGRDSVSRMECTRDKGENAERTPHKFSELKCFISHHSVRCSSALLILINCHARKDLTLVSFRMRFLFATGCRCYTHQHSPSNSLSLHLPPPHFL